MDVSDVVTSAWRITLRFRGLWVVGLFAGTAAGTCQGGPPGAPPIPSGVDEPDLDLQLEDALDAFSTPEATAVLAQIVPIVIGITAILVPVGIAFWLLSIACRAAVIAGGSQAAVGREVSLGAAWSSGLRAFGRLFLLDLIVLLLAVVVLAVLFLTGRSALEGAALTPERIILLALGGFATFGVLGIVSSLLSVVFSHAQRAIVIDQDGPIQSLQTAFGLIRRAVMLNLLLWVVAIAFSIAVGIGLFLALLVVLIPSLIVGGLLGVVIGIFGGSVPVTVITVTVILMVVAIIVGVAATNTFMWNYWTVAYLRLAHPAPPPAPPPEAVAA
jgi:hypothetical protein